MTIPTFRAAGAKASGTGAVTPALPTGIAIGDICILVATTIAGGSISITTAGGGAWTALTGSPIDVALGEKLYVWWRRHASGDSAPTVTPGSDHICAGIGGWYNCIASVDPINVSTTGTETTSDTTFSFVAGISTTVNDCICICICSTGADAIAAQFTAMTNVNLSSLAERMDYCTNSGGGGGFALDEGGLAIAGPIGTWASTLSTATPKAYISFALKPVASQTYEVSATFSGSGSLTDSGIMTISASTPMASNSTLGDSNIASMSPSISFPSNSLVGQSNIVTIEVANTLNSNSLLAHTNDMVIEAGLSFGANSLISQDFLVGNIYNDSISFNIIGDVQEGSNLEINSAITISSSGNFTISNLLEMSESFSLMTNGNLSSLPTIDISLSSLLYSSSSFIETGILGMSDNLLLSGGSAIQEGNYLISNPELNLLANGIIGITDLLELLATSPLNGISDYSLIDNFTINESIGVIGISDISNNAGMIFDKSIGLVAGGEDIKKIIYTINGEQYAKVGKMYIKL